MPSPNDLEILRPYRRAIDTVDADIIAALRRRYDIIEEVGHLKARNGIDAIIPERVTEVRENAAKRAGEAGLDADFIRALYARIIEHSCALEESIIQSHRHKDRAG